MPAVASSPASPAGALLAESPVDPSVALAVARLAEEFSDQLRPQVIIRVVRGCRRDLGGSPVGALPELVERLARIRLSESIV
jgi:hypothetical protein